MQCRAGFDLFLMRLHSLGMRYTITPVSQCIYDCINKYFQTIKKGHNSECQVCISHKLISESIQRWRTHVSISSTTTTSDSGNNNNTSGDTSNTYINVNTDESYSSSITHVGTEDLGAGQNYDPSCPIIKTSAGFCVLRIFKK